MNKLISIARGLACASLMMLTACGSGAPVAEEPPLAGARIGGPFTLVDQQGRSVSDSDFAGKYRLVYFGYSYCPDVCPVDLNWLMLGLKQFETQDPARGAKVQPIFITVDPERDTPQVLANFAPQFHPRLIALTGAPERVAEAASAYLVSYRKQEGGTPDSYLVAHTQLAYLMGPAGEPVALIPVDDIRTTDINEGAPDIVAAELARWVR